VSGGALARVAVDDEGKDAVTAESFRAAVLAAGLLVPGEVDGVYGRSARYEAVADAVERWSFALGDDEGAEPLRFPPVLARAAFERTGYLASFPHLMGSVHSFDGDDAAHAALTEAAESGRAWATGLAPTELMLCSSACHALYPTCTGTLPPEGRRFRVTSWCFRHEPSTELTRMQAFRMTEHVYVGDPEGADASRRRWLERGFEALLALGLPARPEAANDPFFGRTGRFLARTQRDEELKVEIVVPVHDDRPPVAVASSNLHRDHFGVTFAITSADGEPAHSTCFGFGVDRLVLALLRHHGLDAADWPTAVRDRLWP